MSEEEAMASVGADELATIDDVKQLGEVVKYLATMVQLAAIDTLREEHQITAVQVAQWTQELSGIVEQMGKPLVDAAMLVVGDELAVRA